MPGAESRPVVTRQAQCPPHHLWFLASSPDSSVQPSSLLGPEQVGRKGRKVHRCVSQFPLPSAGAPGLMIISCCRKVNKCYRGRSCPIIVHCRCVRAWRGRGDGWGQARPRPEGPEGGTFLVPAPSLVLLSVRISQAHCLPVPLLPANNSPWAKFSIPSIFLMAHELRMMFPFLNS